MRKKKTLRISSWLIPAILATLSLGRPADAADAARPPSFIVIFTDDQGYADLGVYGSPDIKTPRIDAMAAEGVRFTDFYVGAAVCSPSRAALLTGRYAGRNGVDDVYFPWKASGMRPEEVTIAEILKPRGYATATIGKWHLGHDTQFLPMNQGFDYFFGIPYSNDMTIAPDMKVADDVELHGGTLEQLRADQQQVTTRNFKGLKTKVPLMEGDEIVEYPATQDSLTRRFFDRTIKFIEERGEGDPFFIYLNPAMPHFPVVASEGFQGQECQRALWRCR